MKPGSLNLVVQSLLCLALVFAPCGCKQAKAPAATPDAAKPVDPAAAPQDQEKARVAQAAAFRQGIAPPPPTLVLRGGEPATPEVIAAYNQQLAQLIFRQRDGPETLEELVRKWPMPRLPTPPPGKRIIYDPKNRIIALSP